MLGDPKTPDERTDEQVTDEQVTDEGVSERRTHRRFRFAALRTWSLAAVALLLAVGTLFEHLDSRRERREVAALLDTEPLRWLPSEVADELRRERDPVWRRLRLARALVAAEMDPDFLAEVESVEGAERGARSSRERLETARRLATEALIRRPGVWQAPMLLGAATYLARSRARDRGLITAYRDWEAPLELAADLAPGKAEPGRFLTVAYLELWPFISEAKRRIVRRRVADAFRDPTFFHRLVEPWLAVEEDRDEAFAPIPPDPAAWRHVQTLLAGQQDWQGYLEARRRWWDALERTREEEVAEAERRLTGGDLSGARELLLRAATRGRPEPAAVPTLVRALGRLPPGPAGRYADDLRVWLRWCLDLCRVERCPLPASTLDRLAGLAGELEPPEAALVALLAGRLADAERLERRSEELWRPRWSPYLVVKARRLTARGELDAARTALDRVHPGWHDRPLYALARRELEAHAADAGSTEAESRAGLDRHAGPVWPATAWRPVPPERIGGPAHADTDRLELWSAGEQLRLRLELVAVPEGGAVVEVRLDGAPVATRVVRSAEGLRVETSASAGLHQVDLETLAGGRVLPGEVRRLDPADSQ